MNLRTRNRLWRSALALALVSLLLLAWTQRHRFIPVGEGSRAPDYSATTLDGQSVSLASMRGKVVVLNVWATWCRPCLQEMPALERLHQQLSPQGLAIVAVSVDAPVGTVGPLAQPGGDVRAFVNELGLNFMILHDQERTIEQIFLVQGLPTTFVIDKEGRIDRKIVGARVWDDTQHVSYLKQLIQS